MRFDPRHPPTPRPPLLQGPSSRPAAVPPPRLLAFLTWLAAVPPARPGVRACSRPPPLARGCMLPSLGLRLSLHPARLGPPPWPAAVPHGRPRYPRLPGARPGPPARPGRPIRPHGPRALLFPAFLSGHPCHQAPFSRRPRCLSAPPVSSSIRLSPHAMRITPSAGILKIWQRKQRDSRA